MKPKLKDKEWEVVSKKWQRRRLGPFLQNVYQIPEGWYYTIKCNGVEVACNYSTPCTDIGSAKMEADDYVINEVAEVVE